MCGLTTFRKAVLNPCNQFILHSAGANNSYKCKIFDIPIMWCYNPCVVVGDVDDISEVQAALKMEAAYNSETLAELPTDVQCNNPKAKRGVFLSLFLFARTRFNLLSLSCGSQWATLLQRYLHKPPIFHPTYLDPADGSHDIPKTFVKVKLSLCVIKRYALRRMGEWRYSSPILDFGTRWMLMVIFTPLPL
jgi:hypothetical protein